MTRLRSSRDGSGWHQLIEHDTPTGTIGRLLFTLLGGVISLSAVGGGLTALTGPTVGLLELLFGLLFSTGGIAGILICLVVLRPVYLSLIGNIEEPAAYGSGARTNRTRELPEEDDGDPIEVRKYRYAAGELSEDKFERRLTDSIDLQERREESDAERGRIHER